MTLDLVMFTAFAITFFFILILKRVILINCYVLSIPIDTMEDWDQETLEKVVESKGKEYNGNKPTEIVCIPIFFSLFYPYKVKLYTCNTNNFWFNPYFELRYKWELL